MVNEALLKMDGLFAGMYEADVKGGRPSIARHAATGVLQRALGTPYAFREPIFLPVDEAANLVSW